MSAQAPYNNESEPPEEFGSRVRSALAWRYGSQVVAQIITWGSTIMVVRLLDPSDYGLFAMSQVVLAALAFMNGWGFAQSLVQQKNVTRREIGQVFALLLLLNGALALAQVLLAPWAASYFREPQVETMLYVQALFYLTTPFIALPSALLSRELKFKPQGYANMAAAISGALTALGLAWFGYGVWALVYAPIVAFVLRALVLTLAARSLVMPVFDFRGAATIVTFGGAMTVIQLLWIIQSQSDIFIAGRAFDTYDLGLYAEALFLTLIVTARFLPPLNEVAFPAYAELHQSGRSLAPYFLRAMGAVALLTFPIFIGLALTAHEAVETLFGTKWVPMAPIVAGLAIIMPARALEIICDPSTNAIGRPGIAVWSSLFGAIVFTASFLVGVEYGAQGLVRAWWVAAPLLLVFTLALTLPAIGASLTGLVKAIAPAIIACTVMAAAVLALKMVLPDWPSWARLLAKGATGAAVYSAVIWLGWRDMVMESIAFVRNRPSSIPEPGEKVQTTSG